MAAEPGLDYEPEFVPLTFSFGVTRVCHSITIHNDNITEYNETFSVKLVEPDVPFSPLVIVPNGSTDILIIDNDCKFGDCNLSIMVTLGPGLHSHVGHFVT